ncbi:hypothetical protein L596_015681 [Steinernema carpocapsae]|uniref:PDZ domain-containing protein n=1 Tax=Steinernema carpocapsae TaxID=34508 RepID=A0A4U5NGP8_STECR|nr:hypothetical protein L596_015681 [Steinernema carpocapsae]
MAADERIVKLRIVLTEKRQLGLHLKRDLLVKSVSPTTPAHGHFLEGDRITHVNGVAFNNVKDFNAYWEKNKTETLQHDFTIVRFGKSSKNSSKSSASKSVNLSTVVTTDAKPEKPEKLPVSEGSNDKPVTVAVTLNEDRKLGVKFSARKVVEVNEDSCAKGLIEKDDILTHFNGLKIHSNKDFISLWADYVGKTPEFTLLRKEDVARVEKIVEIMLRPNEKIGVTANDKMKVVAVRANSSADGLVKVGDEIIHINEIRVRSNDRMAELLAKIERGKLKMGVLRNTTAGDAKKTSVDEV